MLITEFHREYKIAMDKVDSSAYSEIKPWEVDYFLNEAQDRFVKTRYGKNNIYQEGFEESQKRTDDLKRLTMTKFTEVSVHADLNFFGDLIYKADLDSLFDDEGLLTAASDEYMFYIKSIAYVNKGNCGAWRKVNLVQQNDLTVLMDDPFNRPTPDNVIIYFEDGDIFCVCGSASIDKFQVTFIKRPVQMNIGSYGEPTSECELSEHTHREIVQMAVTITLENIESQRVQSQSAINENKIE